MAIGQGYQYHGSSGPAKIKDGRLWAWNGSGHALKLYPVKEAWAYLPGHGWRQWYPHGGGTTPPTGTHSATAGASVSHSRVSWHIPSGRHVKTQRVTVRARKDGYHGKINGRDVTIKPNGTYSFTVSASTRSVSAATGFYGALIRASVRYTYT